MRVDLDKDCEVPSELVLKDFFFLVLEKALEIGYKAGQADTDLEEVKEKANLTGEQA